MAAPSYQDSKKELIEAMRVTAGSGTPQFDIAKAILDVKAQEAVATEDKKLALATWVLAFATIALVIATVDLILRSHG